METTTLKIRLEPTKRRFDSLLYSLKAKGILKTQDETVNMLINVFKHGRSQEKELKEKIHALENQLQISEAQK